jgi:hypothetical protein
MDYNLIDKLIDWISKKILGKIFFPEDKTVLTNKDNQLSVINNNGVIIYIPSKGYGIANIDNLPPELIKILKDSLSNLPSSSQKATIVNRGFHEKMYAFSEFFEEGDSPLQRILPYLNKEFESILNLSEYVRKLLGVADHNEAQRVKSDIDFEYGSKGRKLCNLYLRGYINRVLEDYAYKIIDSSELTIKEKGDKINDLIEKILNNSDSIFFVYREKDERTFQAEISKKIYLNREFIAIHAGGKTNIGIAKKIIKNLEDEPNFKYYQIKVNEYFDKKSNCPLVDIYLQLDKKS